MWGGRYWGYVKGKAVCGDGHTWFPSMWGGGCRDMCTRGVGV